MLKRKMLEREPPVKLTFNTMLRAYISCAIDSDSPFYTTVSYGASSFLFLGAMQINYEWTLLAMLAFYMITSLGETVRVLLALSHANSLADIVVTSGFLASKLRTVATELRPSNVYEDLGRGKTIVLMVFVTQIILISFVVRDGRCISCVSNSTWNTSRAYPHQISYFLYSALTCSKTIPTRAVMAPPDAPLEEPWDHGYSMSLVPLWLAFSC